MIAGPVSTVDVAQNTNCYDATFTASSRGKRAGSSICGTNTGQHMILEARPGCNRLGKLGATITTLREDVNIEIFFTFNLTSSFTKRDLIDMIEWYFS